MKNFLVGLFVSVLLLAAAASPGLAQSRTPVVGSKVTYGPVTGITNAAYLWSTALPSLNYSNAIVHWVTSGSPTCNLAVKTGPTAATATLAVDDPNHDINCGSSGTKVVSGLNNYFNLYRTLSVGSNPTLSVYVTFTNFAGNALNQTLSVVSQGDGAASPGAVPWYVRGTDGTNLTPAGDVAARAVQVAVSDGTHALPGGDAAARGIYTVPGNGTTAFKDVKAGVSAQGAGIQQVATVGTLSAAVASNTTDQVVAAPSAGLSTVLLGVLIEKATNTTGYVNVITGTGTKCGSNTATLFSLGPSTASSPLNIGYYPVGMIGTAVYEICLQTDGSGTSARVLTQ